MMHENSLERSRGHLTRLPLMPQPSSFATRPVPPPAALVVIALLLGVGLWGSNGLLAIFAVGVLIAGFAWLWRPGEAPILLFVFCLQWLQASTKIFHASVLGIDIGTLSAYGGQVELATWLSLLAVLVLAAGLRLGAGAWDASVPAIIRDQARQRLPRFWFYLYGIAVLVASVAQSFAWSIAGLSQPLLALASIKWAFYWMLAYSVLVRPHSDRRYLAIAFGLEFTLSLGGYFSDFKTVLIFTVLAIVAAGIRLTQKQYFSLATLGALTVLLGIVWTAVKIDYRNFASGGAAAQIVTVGYGQRLSYLADLVEKLDGEAVGSATEGLVERLSYVDFFGVVLDVVPDQRPHENGSLWWDAVTRPFMPRLFFPEKTVIDDSQRTNYYTGLTLAGTDQGTSISIGYVAESYIDFAVPWMFLPIFALGLLLGRLYFWLPRIIPAWQILGMGLATSTIYGASFLESSITKLIGGLVVTTLVSWLLLRFAARSNFSLIESWAR